MDPIAVAGGGAQSDLWCRMHADVLGRTVHRVADPRQVNARGAGLLALAGVEHLSVADIGARVPIAARYEPDAAAAAVYDAAYLAFRRLHRANRRLYARLNPAA
jgi:xylulokinase